jgi:hypothetical protein
MDAGTLPTSSVEDNGAVANEPPEGPAVLPWLTKQANRDREALVLAAAKLREAADELMVALGRRVAFWQNVVDEAPTRRAAARSRHMVSTGVAAAFAEERLALLSAIEGEAEHCAGGALDLTGLGTP